MSRAGLASLILFFFICIGLAESAPLPERPSSLVERYDDFDHLNDVVIRSLAMILDREFDITADPELTKREYLSILDDLRFGLEDHKYTKRDFDDLPILHERPFYGQGKTYSKRDYSDVHTLYRRGFWGRITSGFKRMGNAIKSGFHKVQGALRMAGNAIKSGFRKATGRIRSGFQKAAGALRNGFRKAGGAIKSGLQRVKQGVRTAGRAMKKGFGIVGTTIKNHIGELPKFTKFGLKVVAAASSVASKVAKFVPGIGTGIGVALKGVSMGANAASDKIHADLGNLDKASAVMDYAIGPLSSVGKAAGKGAGAQALEAVESILMREY